MNDPSNLRYHDIGSGIHIMPVLRPLILRREGFEPVSARMVTRLFPFKGEKDFERILELPRMTSLQD